MKQSKARLIVYALWGTAFASSMFAIQFASVFRRNIIDPAESQASLVKIAALYLPILTAFGTFWYRHKGPTPKISITTERWVGALSATVFYQLFMLVRIFHINYFEPYASLDGQPRSTYLELMSAAVETGMLLSPLATLPIAYLLGVEELTVASKPPE